MPLTDPIIDRRAFLSGRLHEADRLMTPPETDIASVLMQARPERMAEVEAAVTALAGCEVHARDPIGKLVVVIETSSAGAVGSTLNAIALLLGVLSASLVFHAVDADEGH